MALIDQTNAQYYNGSQVFTGLDNNNGANPISVTTDFDVNLIWEGPQTANNALPNFDVFLTSGSVTTLLFIDTDYECASNPSVPQVNTIEIFASVGAIQPSDYIEVKLKQFVLNNQYGNYRYITLNDLIENFLVGYVGVGKLIPSVKKSDVTFDAKRGLQEFSYDTLKSIKSVELDIPPSLSIVIPQDYVNYVRCSWIDKSGAKHIIYPTTVSSSPTELPIQDKEGLPMQSLQDGSNIQAQQSITEERWQSQGSNTIFQPDDYRYPRRDWVLGKRYGLEPFEAQCNGTYIINERLGKISFSSDLAGKTIILEYISDGLGYEEDMKVPKLAEEAMYMHIIHGILASRSGVPEYIVQRYKKDRSSTLRNAKIRLSNIKIGEISQVMRNKSKWIKH